MQLFIVKGNGEAHEIKEETPIKKLLESNECYVVVDDKKRNVYLWIGSNASVRSKFNGARISQDIRSQVGLSYRSISLEEADMNKDPDFLEAIEEIPSEGFAREIREEGKELEFREPANSPPSSRNISKLKSRYNQIEQAGPLYTGQNDHLFTSSAPSTTTSTPTKEKLEEIIQLLDKEDIPEGFEREMVIVGDHSYSVTEKKQSFLGKESIERVLEPISTLPEGLFFAEGYAPRVLVKDQKVIAIEFLKKMNF
ncbi:MAG: hypothetical protein DRO88_01595 [Promethearchaeia archaeon]|nr:MAG: hypothetical protein DRO88_01595 [Candidatus Lokiarchaeia archaeon]